jgi:pyruvate dehydrogenase E1 component alpha subunit
MEKSDYLRLYQQMVLIRRIEEKCAELYQQGKIGGFLHLYIGQEAVGVGAVAAMKPQDHVITAYRDHGIALAVGMDAGVMMAELLGKATGCSGGKGGSMHLADVSKNFWGGHAIVGAHLPLATGLALSFQYQHNDSAIICMMGDGATNIGYFHESLNLSKVWKLPVVWMVENNQYGMGTAIERASAVSEIRQKAEGYAIESARVDGMDVLAMKDATAAALDHARSGNGPYFLEAMTYRFRGHSMGDPERYRKPDEIKKWQEDDPIGKYYDHLTKKKLATAKELEAIEAQVEEETAAAVRFAEESPNPAPEALWENIYA